MGQIQQSWLVALLLMVFFSLNLPTGPLLGDSGQPQPQMSPEEVIAKQSPLPVPTPTPSPSPTPEQLAAVEAAGRLAAAKPAVLGSTAAASNIAYGVADGMAALPAPVLATQLAGIKALGAGWVRYDIEWSNIEAEGPGQYNWADYDRMVAAVSAAGLKALAVIDYTPEWARRPECRDTAMCSPADPAAYGRFAAVAAARYKPYGVHTWEIWNEPNSEVFFKPGANVGQYVELLKAAHAGIKSVDPGALILSGGTAPGDTGGGWISPPDFVNGLYAAGGRPYFDALAHHPYTWPYSPGYRMPGNAWDQMNNLRATMVRHGDAAKKMWLTEFGAPTGGPGPLAGSGYTTAEGAADHVTEALEARIATDAVAAIRAMPWVGGFFWYSYKDNGGSTDTVENFFGLLRADGSKKPAYSAYAAAIAGR